jgi:hypothetical protein
MPTTMWPDGSAHQLLWFAPVIVVIALSSFTPRQVFSTLALAGVGLGTLALAAALSAQGVVTEHGVRAAQPGEVLTTHGFILVSGVSVAMMLQWTRSSNPMEQILAEVHGERPVLTERPKEPVVALRKSRPFNSTTRRFRKHVAWVVTRDLVGAGIIMKRLGELGYLVRLTHKASDADRDFRSFLRVDLLILDFCDLGGYAEAIVCNVRRRLPNLPVIALGGPEFPHWLRPMDSQEGKVVMLTKPFSDLDVSKTMELLLTT